MNRRKNYLAGVRRLYRSLSCVVSNLSDIDDIWILPQ